MIATILILCCLLFAAGPAQAQTREPTALDYALRAAEDLIADGRSAEALRSLRSLREREKKDARIPFLMAQCEFNLWRADRKKTDHIERARTLIEETFRLKHAYPECSFLAGWMEYEAGNWAAAEIGFRGAIAGRFRAADARQNLALCIFHHGVEVGEASETDVERSAEAIVLFRRARDRLRELAQDTRLLPDRRAFFRNYWLKAWSNMAAMHQKAGNYPAAIEEVKALRKVQPDSPHHCHNLGLMYGEMSEWDTAIGWYEKALSLGEKDGFVEPHLRLAYIRSKRQERERAEAHFAKFFAKFPKDWEAHYERGEHYRRFREYDKAIADFLKCLEIDPEAYLPMKSLSECYRLNGDREQADEWLKKFREKDEEDHRKTAPPQPDEEKDEKETDPEKKVPGEPKPD